MWGRTEKKKKEEWEARRSRHCESQTHGQWQLEQEGEREQRPSIGVAA